jgi:hypothetical protein
LVLGDSKDWNDVSGQWDHEWPLDTSVDSPMFPWLGDTFLRILFNQSGKDSEPQEDKAPNEGLLHKPESLKRTMPRALPAQQAVLFCGLPGRIRHVTWTLTIFFVDNLFVFYMFAEMGNDEGTEMQLKFQDSPNPSVFVTTPKVGGTGLNVTAANHARITDKIGVVIEEWQEFAWVVRLGQNRVLHPWLLNTGPNGYDNRGSNLHQISGVAPMRVLHGLMNQPNITMNMP